MFWRAKQPCFVGYARVWRALSSRPAFALWSPNLAPMAKPVAEQTAWARVGQLVSAGSWGLFEQAGLMVSGRDALTPTHYDGHHNIFLQLAGAKRFLLFGAELGGAPPETLSSFLTILMCPPRAAMMSAVSPVSRACTSARMCSEYLVSR